METIELPIARMTVEVSGEAHRLRLRRVGSTMPDSEREWRSTAWAGRCILGASAPWTRRPRGSRLPARATYAFGVLPPGTVDLDIVFRRRTFLPLLARERRAGLATVAGSVWAAEAPGHWDEVVVSWAGRAERQVVAATPGRRRAQVSGRGALLLRPDDTTSTGP